MATIRVQKEKNYVVINKTAFEDENLSFKAKGIFGYLMSKPDDWTTNVKDLQNNSTDGRDSVYAGLKELREHGYLVKTATRNAKGQFEWEEILYEIPQESAKEIFKQQIEKKSTNKYKKTSSTIYGKTENGKTVKGNAVNIINTELLNNYLLNNYCISNSNKDFLFSLKGINEMKLKTLIEYIESTSLEFIETIINYSIQRRAKTLDYILNTIEKKIAENIITTEDFNKSVMDHKEKVEKDRLTKINKKIQKELDNNLKELEIEDSIKYYEISNEKLNIDNMIEINYIKKLLSEKIDEVKYNTWIKTLNIYKDNNYVYIISLSDLSRNKVAKEFIGLIRNVLVKEKFNNKIKLILKSNVN